MPIQNLFPTMLLLLLSCFSRVRLCATLQTEAHQAPPSLGFSRQEHWSGLPFPSPMHEKKSEREVTQSCPTLSDPRQPTRLHRPWDFPGKSIGVGCHCLLRFQQQYLSKQKQKGHSQENKIRSILKESLKQVLQEEGTR